MSPLAGGLIPANEEKFAFLAKENGPTYEALRFITSLPYVDCCYLSTANKEEVDIACEIADIDQPMDDEAIAEMEKLVGSGLDGACTGCGYCEDSCPQKIPIPAYMQFYNFKHLFGKPDDEMAKRLDWARRWFMLANRKADAKDCIACGDCAKLCTQKIDIPTRMKYLGDIERGL
jgi:predicted aldo/keto reductase-like oxidoreductase